MSVINIGGDSTDIFLYSWNKGKNMSLLLGLFIRYFSVVRITIASAKISNMAEGVQAFKDDNIVRAQA